MKRIFVSTLLVISCHICFCQTKAEQYMNNPPTALAEAQRAFHSGEYKKALKLIRIYQALSGEKDAPEIYQKANDCYEMLEKERVFEEAGNYDRAIELLKKIKSINPKDEGISSRIQHIQRLIASNLEWVDLGLSVKWATCNVGATTPSDYGDYFAWGAIETWYEEGFAQSDPPKWKSGKENGYCFENYPYWITGHSWNGPDYPKFSKYSPTQKYWGGLGNPDNKIVLDLGDDVAHVKYGKNWRMPTKHEYDELINNCIAERTYLNGIFGLKLISKKNGNSIFLPASGFIREDDLQQVGLCGIYWCSSLNVAQSDGGENVFFNDEYLSSAGCYRSEGLSVRPVTK